MNIESQFCSLELAKRLKELLVPQKSLFYWSKCCSSSNEFKIENIDWHDIRTDEWDDGHGLIGQEIYSAFSVAELGEMLPVYVEKDDTVYENFLRIDDAEYSADNTLLRPRLYVIGYKFMENGELDYFSFKSKKEVDGRAQLIIHLIENGHVKVEDLNGRRN